MGLFNTYSGVQLKINRDMNSYKIGDQVDIPDGAYLGWEGVVIITDGILSAMYPKLTNKWGQEIDIKRVLNYHDG